MKYNPRIHHRKSIRLKEYDYSRAGLFFVTICCQNMACLFGEIVDGEMKLNDAGIMVDKIWNEIPIYYNGFNIHQFVVMPNHIHGIIEIVGADLCVCPLQKAFKSLILTRPRQDAEGVRPAYIFCERTKKAAYKATFCIISYEF